MLAVSQIIHRKNELVQKLGGPANASGGQIDPKAIERAAKSMRSRTGDFRKEAFAALDAMEALLASLRPDARRNHSSIIENLTEQARELKGLAATFGYPLVSDFSDSLYELTRAVDTPNSHQLELIDAHLQAIRAVLTQNITGDGGEIGSTLGATLRDAIRRVAVAPAE